MTGPRVRALRRLLNQARHKRWRAEIGRRCQIDPSVQIANARNVRIGDATVIGADCWLTVNRRDADEPRLVIGPRGLLGRRGMVSAGEYLELGAYLLTGPDCRFLAADHDADNPAVPYAISGVKSDMRMIVEDNCWFGAGASVLGNVHIGRGSIVGAGSMVLKDMPPFSLAVGAPAKIIRRFSFPRNRWVAVAEFTAADEAALPSIDSYRAALDQSAVKWPSLKAAGGIRPGDSY